MQYVLFVIWTLIGLIWKLIGREFDLEPSLNNLVLKYFIDVMLCYVVNRHEAINVR